MIDTEAFKMELRDVVLAAMDELAEKHFADKGKRALGATDAELPALFGGLDAHAERAYKRLSNELNVPLQKWLEQERAPWDGWNGEAGKVILTEPGRETRKMARRINLDAMIRREDFAREIQGDVTPPAF